IALPADIPSPSRPAVGPAKIRRLTRRPIDRRKKTKAACPHCASSACRFRVSRRWPTSMPYTIQMDSSRDDASSAPGERLYVGGSLTTMSTAEAAGAHAIAVRGDTIVAVGTAEQARAALSASAKVIDLEGGHIMPGINDSHAHIAALGTSLPPLAADLSHPGVRSIDEARTRVAEQARKDRKSTRLNSSHVSISYAVFC